VRHWIPLVAIVVVQQIQNKKKSVKGIVSPDWKGLQMVSLDRFEV
jgi:co-chaperonin GroES (HSP10)